MSKRLALVLIAVLVGATLVAAAEEVPILVVEPSGEPAAGAEVLLLESAGTSLDNDGSSPVLARARCDEAGRARLPAGRDHLCVLAWRSDAAVLVCNRPRGDGVLRLVLEPAVRIRGRLAAPEGASLEGAAVRAIVPGGYEIHGIDARVGKDGSITLPPLPPVLFATGAAYLEVRVPGLCPRNIPLHADGPPLAVTLRRPRRVAGRVVAGDALPVAGARVAFVADTATGHHEVLHPTGLAETRVDGAFAVDLSPTAGGRLYILPDDHAAMWVPIDEGAVALDLGPIAVDPGRAIRGRVREEDDRPVVYGFASLMDDRGVRVRSASIGRGGAFELPHVGDGPHRLLIWVHESEGIAGSRTVTAEVEAGGEPLDLVVPKGFVIRLRDEAGAPVTTTAVDVEVGPSGEADTDSHQSSSGTSELRLPLAGPASRPVVVRVPGYAPARGTAEVGAGGRGELTLVLKRGPGATSFPRPHVSSFIDDEKPKTEALRAIRPPDLDDRADVARYVDEILATTDGRRSFSTRDPETRLLAAVGPDHVDVLVDVLDRRDGRLYVEWALDRLIAAPHRELVLARLDECRELAKFLVPNGWAEAARATLTKGLEEALEHESGVAYLPQGWIEALASLRDPETYPLLTEFLARGLNKRHTYEAIADLPGIRLETPVAYAWVGTREDPYEAGRMAPVAARFGHVDALHALVASLSASDSGRPGVSRIPDALPLIRQLTGYDGPSRAEDVRRWFEGVRDRLEFDSATRKYVVRDK